MKKYTDVKPDVKKLKLGDENLKNIFMVFTFATTIDNLQRPNGNSKVELLFRNM